MLQAKMMEPGKIIFEEVEVPGIEDNEVLIRVKKIGICGSDIHVFHGEHPYTDYPVIQGHEFSGEIVKVGINVEKFQKGDKVVVQPQVVCGKCYHCRHGDYHICDNLKVMGFQTDGWAREYYKVEADKVLKLPEGVTDDQGALVEPVAVACHALSRGNMDLANKNILVLGAGTIGNLIAQVAKAKGAAQVMVTDISDYRLELARKCGVDITVNVEEKNLRKEIVNNFGEDKADLILECVGNQSTINQAINNARKGSTVVVVGVFPKKVNVNMGYVQDRELTLTGTLMYKEEDYREAIELISQGKISDDLLITDYFDFKYYEEAYKYIDEQKDKVMKVMINVDELKRRLI